MELLTMHVSQDKLIWFNRADMYSIEDGIGGRYHRVRPSLVVLGRSGHSSGLAPVRRYFGRAIFISISAVEAIRGAV
jgi:hypothetical protein